jgi:hypothetical protein
MRRAAKKAPTIKALAAEKTAETPRLATELAFASDGCIYVNAEGIDPRRCVGRDMFVGYAMTPAEVRVIGGVRGLLLLGLFMRIAPASDGQVYVDYGAYPPIFARDRDVSRGLAMTDEEAEIAVDAIHRQAFNVTVEVQIGKRERRGKRTYPARDRGRSAG